MEVTGLRGPCTRINGFREGLLKRAAGRDSDGTVRLRSGIMSVVLIGGVVRPGDPVRGELP